MNYLLRIINQQLSQCVEAKNYSLEGEDYVTLLKVENAILPDIDSPFDKVLYKYYEDKGLSINKREDETIVGFVFGKNRVHPIHNYEVAYIVNDKGQTIERVYGQYEKY